MDAAQCTATPRCPRRTVAVKWHWMLRCFGLNLVNEDSLVPEKIVIERLCVIGWHGWG